MKDKLLEITRGHAKSIGDIQKRFGRYSGAQVQAGSLLSAVQAVASIWFDGVRPALEGASFSPESVRHGTDIFERVLRFAKSRPSKARVLAILSEAIALYREIIHTIETTSFASQGTLSITPYIEGLAIDEGEYLDEAQRCLTVNGIRACVVLGWCAAIARIHKKIEDIGYEKFNQATVEMAGKTTGRFKFFTKKISTQSRSELQTVFDTDLLWVMEYLQLIDNNQHQRLRYCFELRNNSAHPGLAPIKGPNLYSFYSDISEIVLKNEKFAVKARAYPFVDKNEIEIRRSINLDLRNGAVSDDEARRKKRDIDLKIHGRITDHDAERNLTGRIHETLRGRPKDVLLSMLKFERSKRNKIEDIVVAWSELAREFAGSTRQPTTKGKWDQIKTQLSAVVRNETQLTRKQLDRVIADYETEKPADSELKGLIEGVKKKLVELA